MTLTAEVDCPECDCPHEIEYEYSPASYGPDAVQESESVDVYGVGSRCNGAECHHVYTKTELEKAAYEDLKERRNLESDVDFDTTEAHTEYL